MGLSLIIDKIKDVQHRKLQAPRRREVHDYCQRALCLLLHPALDLEDANNANNKAITNLQEYINTLPKEENKLTEDQKLIKRLNETIVARKRSLESCLADHIIEKTQLVPNEAPHSNREQWENDILYIELLCTYYNGASEEIKEIKKKIKKLILGKLSSEDDSEDDD